MRSVSALVLFVLTAAPTVVAQPRSEQVDPSALAAAAARLGRVIWSPMATLDCIGVDPFVLRPPVATECLDRTVYCPPVYRSDFVLGGVAGADVWMNLSERLLVQSQGRAVVDWYREFLDVSSVASDVSQAVRYVAPRVHLDFGWRHVQSRRGMLAELAQCIRRTAFDRRLTCPQLSSITAMASSSEAAITQPALSAATRSSSLGVAAIQMATAEVSSCTAQHCSNVSSRLS